MHSKHYNIPIFIPHAGCPHQCIFCSQKKISDASGLPSVDEVKSKIEKYLSTIPADSAIEIAFFGGSFTGIPVEEQEKYLRAADQYVTEGRVRGIRLSTRPDYIDIDSISFLKSFGVTAIELGVQSMDNDVLERSVRGHTPEDVARASVLIKSAGVSLGLQMMIGLPGDTLAKAMMTAISICDLGADTARIYPAIVIKGTGLEDMYRRGEYEPLSLDEAVAWSAELFAIFEKRGIKVIRMGLHPSEGLLSGESIAAGPFHPSFRELVLSEIWRRQLKDFLNEDGEEELVLFVNPGEFNWAIGYNGSNKKMLSRKFKKVIYKREPGIQGRYYGAKYC